MPAEHHLVVSRDLGGPGNIREPEHDSCTSVAASLVTIVVVVVVVVSL